MRIAASADGGDGTVVLFFGTLDGNVSFSWSKSDQKAVTKLSGIVAAASRGKLSGIYIKKCVNHDEEPSFRP
jgi:hypothetical protein